MNIIAILSDYNLISPYLYDIEINILIKCIIVPIF